MRAVPRMPGSGSRRWWFWKGWGRAPGPAPPPAVDPVRILQRARRLRFRVRPEAVSALAGAYHGARPGTGLTFAELSPYEPGDDVRHLDWNVTARQQRPYVRRYIEERALTLWLMVDLSASLRFGPANATKADRAAQAAALLAAAAIQSGDRVGLVLVTDQIEAEQSPAGGNRQLARLLRMLVTTPARSRRSALLPGIRGQGRRHRRGLVVILSDFLEIEPAREWRAIGRRHDVIALRVVDPLEERLPDVGLLRLTGLETGGSILVDTSSKRVRASYARAARRRQAAFQALCRDIGAAGYDLPTDVDPIRPLLSLFRGRGPGRSRPH